MAVGAQAPATADPGYRVSFIRMLSKGPAGRGWLLMCTADGSGCALAAPGQGFASVADALSVTSAAARYLNSAAAGLDGPARAEALEQLGSITSLLGAASNGLMRRFDAADDHDADGYATTAAWLAAKTRLGRRDARAAVRRMRLLGRHPSLDAATASGAITISWAREVAAWTGRIDHDELQSAADKILVEAATAGADLDDLKLLAQAAYEAWRAQEPDPEEDPAGRGFGDRHLILDTTLDNACELLIRAKMVPDRAGADTRVDVTIPLSDLLAMDGASAVEDTWLRARAGEHGYLAGKDAEAVACDALIVPVVTGSPDWAVIGQMITLITDAYGHAAARAAAAAAPPARPGGPARAAGSALPAWPQPLEPEQWQDLQHALARLAIHFVSGPGAIASALRRALLDAPLNAKSVILDVGYSDTIPDAIRKAVIARDKGCAWPGGCHRRPAHCDVHHVKHKKHGGKTSVKDCVLLCQYHHDICIHRMGWEFELLPDGSTRATSPDGKVVLRSHGPPPAQPGG